MRTVSFSEARSHFKSVCDDVAHDVEETVITRRNADDLVLMSLEQYNALQERAYLTRNPIDAKILMDAIEELEAGRGQEHNLIEP